MISRSAPVCSLLLSYRTLDAPAPDVRENDKQVRHDAMILACEPLRVSGQVPSVARRTMTQASRISSPRQVTTLCLRTE